MARNKGKARSGVFGREADPLMERFNASIGFDRTLYAEDIAGSIAYAEALQGAGVITAAEYARIRKGLTRVREEIEKGRFVFCDADEDIHMAVEARLGRYAGAAAAKLHTGRSRNEQVAVDERLYLLRIIDQIDGLVKSVQQEIVRQADRYKKAVMPGYTHVQQGQLVRFSHYLLALFHMLQRDRERLAGCRRRTDRMPLGSGALAGNAFALDRKKMAARLGFTRISENSIDAVSDRDFLLEFQAAAAILSMHLARYCEDLIVWSSPEFGFITLDDRYATGSSLMPQKRNPDSLELVRGKTGRIYGNMAALFTVMKGLPLTYSKDLQEDKEPLFDTVETLRMVLPVFAGALKTLTVNTDRLLAGTGDGVYATDLVEHLVAGGMAFRDAHHRVGGMIRKGTYAAALRQAGLADPAGSVNRKNDDGGTSLKSVRAQLAAARRLLKKKPA